MPAITATTATTATSRTTAASSGVDFKPFTPQKIVTKTDGSVVLNGMMNRSVSADVRLTKAGKLMVDSHLWNKKGVEHEASKAELKSLKANLTKFLSTVRLTQPQGKAYEKLMSGIDAALAAPTFAEPKKVTNITAKRLLMSANHALQNGNLKWDAHMPLGQRYVEVPLFAEKHPDGFKYTALVPVGVLAPNAKVNDPNLASSFIIKREGGIAGMTSFSKFVDVVR